MSPFHLHVCLHKLLYSVERASGHPVLVPAEPLFFRHQKLLVELGRVVFVDDVPPVAQRLLLDADQG